MPETVALGGVPSGADYRDKYAAIAASAEQASITLPPVFHTDVGMDLYQRKIPACVANSVVYIMRLYWFRKTGHWIDFSPRYLDILSSEPDIPLDGGRRPRTVLKVAATAGCCTTKLLPNNTNLSIAQYRSHMSISPEMNAEAAQYKIPGYFSVGFDQRSTRTAIYLHGAISTLFEVGKEMYTAPDGRVSWSPDDINPLRTPRVIESGHEMTLNGWENDLVNHVRNQWSKGWSMEDEAHYDWTKWAPYIIEQWAVAEIPKNVNDFLKTLPSPMQFHYVWNQDLRKGMPANDDVRFMQIALMILGFLEPIPSEELGFYGGKTAAGVAMFQRTQHINPQFPDSFGPKSRTAMNMIFSL